MLLCLLKISLRHFLLMLLICAKMRLLWCFCTELSLYKMFYRYESDKESGDDMKMSHTITLTWLSIAMLAVNMQMLTGMFTMFTS